MIQSSSLLQADIFCVAGSTKCTHCAAGQNAAAPGDCNVQNLNESYLAYPPACLILNFPWGGGGGFSPSVLAFPPCGAWHLKRNKYMTKIHAVN
jgi:hypothetical protein